VLLPLAAPGLLPVASAHDTLCCLLSDAAVPTSGQA